MNRAYFVLVIICLVLPTTLSGDVPNLPPDVKSFLQTQDVMDDGYRSIPPTPEGHAFRNYMASNWQAVLDNIQSVAPNPKAQRLIISALDDLPARTYLKALDKLCDLQTHGAISSEMLAYAFKGHRRSLLSKNYQDPDVIDLAHRVQTQLPKNTEIQQWAASVLSGKQHDIDARGASDAGEPEPEVLAPR
jgi:hypothetical protein